MKNKNTPQETIQTYTEIVESIYQKLNSLQDLMSKEEFSEAVEYDQEECDGGFCLNGEFSSFVQDLAEMYARG